MNTCTHPHLLCLRDLTVTYGGIPALHHINLTLKSGRAVGLIGPNGAGKTTFLKALAGLVPYETGRIDFEGHTTCKRDRGIAYLPQREAIDWDFPTTVRGLVEMGRYAALGTWQSYTKADDNAVDEALTVMNLRELANRHISALSGGQQQRAFLARAWAQQAHIYLLDEPFTGLDKNAQEDLGLALRKLTKEGKLVIASHHQMDTVPTFFDDVILLNGELVAFGPTQEIFTEAWINKTFSTSVIT